MNDSQARRRGIVEGESQSKVQLMAGFLLQNGEELVASQRKKYETFLRLAEGRLWENKLEDWIRQRLKTNSD